MTEKSLLYRVENNTARIVINREAQRNAIDQESLVLFHEYLDRAERDEQVRVVLVTGAGEKAFCTGAQLSGEMSDQGENIFDSYARLVSRLANFPKPSVARVKGYCLAGGMGFMLACDIVIASEESKFGTPEVNVGLWPMMIGALIFRNVLKKKAMEMILLGQRLTAGQALDMGLITRVVKSEELDREVDGVVSSLAAKSPIGMRIGKLAFRDAADMPFDQALTFLARKIHEVAGTQDAVEGITAFLEKRPPCFTGK